MDATCIVLVTYHINNPRDTKKENELLDHPTSSCLFHLTYVQFSNILYFRRDCHTINLYT